MQPEIVAVPIKHLAELSIGHVFSILLSLRDVHIMHDDFLSNLSAWYRFRKRKLADLFKPCVYTLVFFNSVIFPI